MAVRKFPPKQKPICKSFVTSKGTPMKRVTTSGFEESSSKPAPKKRVETDVRKRLCKMLGMKPEIITGVRLDQKADTIMDKVLEKFKIQYATENKTFVGIKLTDSFLNSCLNFQKLQKHLIDGCKIKFNGDDGEISIPSESGDRQFKFRSNRFNQEFDECLLQNKDTIFVTGLISKRLNVQGNEDAYKATKDRMTLVEQESKKNCTKVLDKGFNCFEKNQFRPKSLTHVLAPQTNGFKSKPSLSSIVRPKPPIDLAAEVGSRRCSTNPRPPPAGTPRNSKPVTSPVVEMKALLPPPPLNLDFNAIVNYTYRERIVHLLAIRPYKMTELKNVLDGHGPSDRDKLPWTSVLGSVAVLKSSENSYSLRPIIFSEVKEDWPFYDDETRQVIKKKLRELRHRSTSPCSNSSNSSHSSRGSTSSAGQVQKRSATEDSYFVPAKKPRVAHSQKPVLHDVVTLSPLRVVNPSETCVSPLLPPPRHVSVSCAVAPPAPVAASMAVDYPLDGFVSNEELENLPSHYGPITDPEQREKYRIVFESGAREYGSMYGNINAYIKVFAKLERKLKAASPSEVEAVHNEIYISYLKLKDDREYVSQRSALDRLKKKLNHIRCMIEDYDDRVLDPSLS